MKISILTDTDELHSIDVTPELTVNSKNNVKKKIIIIIIISITLINEFNIKQINNLKKSISSKINVPSDEIILIYNGNPIKDENKTISDCSISNDDIVQLIRRYILLFFMIYSHTI